MGEAKGPKSGSSALSAKSTEGEDRQADATSSETLSDLEETQGKSKLKSDGAASDNSSAVPSPDGSSVTERSGRADGSDTGEPM